VPANLFLSRTVLPTVFVPDRRYLPASRRIHLGGSARRYRRARHG